MPALVLGLDVVPPDRSRDRGGDAGAYPLSVPGADLGLELIRTWRTFAAFYSGRIRAASERGASVCALARSVGGPGTGGGAASISRISNRPTRPHTGEWNLSRMLELAAAVLTRMTRGFCGVHPNR